MRSLPWLSWFRLSCPWSVSLRTLSSDVPPTKQVVVQHLGLLGQSGQMSKTRDLNAAWNSAKRQVAREHPATFCLDGKSAATLANALASDVGRADSHRAAILAKHAATSTLLSRELPQ